MEPVALHPDRRTAQVTMHVLPKPLILGNEDPLHRVRVGSLRRHNSGTPFKR